MKERKIADTGSQSHLIEPLYGARAFATKAHEGQTYGANEPYTIHLEAVAGIVAGDEMAEVVAWLHDVVEDTTVTIKDVEAHFGIFIAECVALLTDENGANRKERKAKSHAKLAKVQPQHYVALKVKVADRVANVEASVSKGNNSLLDVYRKEQEAFKAAVYRVRLCDDLWHRIEAALAV